VNYIKRKPWEIKGLKPTDEAIHFKRREIIKSLGLISANAMTLSFLNSCGVDPELSLKCNDGGNTFEFDEMYNFYPASRNNIYSVDRELTKEYDATHRNNYYEFIDSSLSSIYDIYEQVDKFDTCDWEFEVSGMANNTGTFYLEDIIKQFDIEERLYKFRCVEKWTMAVPWTGIPFSKLINFMEPTNDAQYVKMISYSNSKQMPGIKSQSSYPWPYFEGLRLDDNLSIQ